LCTDFLEEEVLLLKELMKGKPLDLSPAPRQNLVIFLRRL
jgi:hypothetical protein